MTELHGEKIDIVDYSDDPAVFVAAALSPVARATRSRSSTRRCAPPGSIVPDYQLSLAIGKEGQNARLAAKLTGLAHRHPLRHGRPGGRGRGAEGAGSRLPRDRHATGTDRRARAPGRSGAPLAPADRSRR